MSSAQPTTAPSVQLTPDTTPVPKHERRKIELRYLPSRIGQTTYNRILSSWTMDAPLGRIMAKVNAGKPPDMMVIQADVYAIISYNESLTGKPIKRRVKGELSLEHFKRLYQVWQDGLTLHDISKVMNVPRFCSRQFLDTTLRAINRRYREELVKPPTPQAYTSTQDWGAIFGRLFAHTEWDDNQYIQAVFPLGQAMKVQGQLSWVLPICEMPPKLRLSLLRLLGKDIPNFEAAVTGEPVTEQHVLEELAKAQEEIGFQDIPAQEFTWHPFKGFEKAIEDDQPAFVTPEQADDLLKDLLSSDDEEE